MTLSGFEEKDGFKIYRVIVDAKYIRIYSDNFGYAALGVLIFMWRKLLKYFNKLLYINNKYYKSFLI